MPVSDDNHGRAMTPQELREALKYSKSTFDHYQAAGKFERFELVPRLGPHRYSRKAVQAYLNREPPIRPGR